MIAPKKLFLILVLSFVSQLAQAWPAALDWSADNNGDQSDKHIVDVYSRCNTPMSEYEGVGGIVPPDYCHRWNLIWGFDGTIDAADSYKVTLTPQVDWNPEVVTDFRLPTIKELIRLFDYSGSQGITDSVIAHWLSNGCRDLSDDALTSVGDDGTSCDQVGIALKDNSAAKYNALKDGYIISSTYRDIDGVDGNSFAHFFGIRIKDGKVVLFEAGAKGTVFNEYINKDNMLALCPGLLKDGTGKITGGCDYRVDDAVSVKHAADYAVVPVYALLVREEPLVQ